MSAATVLVVDNQQIVRDVIGRMLRGAGYAVLSAAGPHQALEIVRGNRTVDLLVSDIEMPEMRGAELVSEVLRISPETATVLMTGGAEVAPDVPAGTPLLRWPISTHDLLAIVRDVLARSAKVQLELKQGLERLARLRQQHWQLRTEFQVTARKAAEELQRSRARPSERSALDQETNLRQDLLAAQTEWHQAMRELDEFCLNIQAQGEKTPDRCVVLESVAGRQQTSFERFVRALQALTAFRSVPQLATRGRRITKRELEVLGRLAAGKTTKQIAHELNIALRTVFLHRHNLLHKFAARNVAMLVSKALRARYIQL